MKGLASFLELTEVHDVCHEVETLLDLARNSKLVVTPEIVDTLLESSDYVTGETNRIEARIQGVTTGPAASNEALRARLRVLATRSEVAAPPTPPPPAPPKAPEPVSVEIPDLDKIPFPEGTQEAAPVAPSVAPVVPAAAPAASTPAAPAGAATPQPARPATPEHAVEQSLVKVETRKVDYLVDMVGEMLVTQSLIRHDVGQMAATDLRLARNLSQLVRITDEVQRAAMAMRLVPVGQLFQKMKRLVRDIARKSGKPVELETEGDDIEIDRNIVEELADPLMHMIRNSMDHGIEEPEARKAAGKDPTGKITLAACHQASQILITITDDGQGLNRDKILAKAKQRGLIDPAAFPSDAEVFSMIFEAGFSTAEKVTSLSGRGVGMDVVRKHIHTLRGRIEVSSTPGVGTTFLLKLPLTLAIIDGLVVGIGQDERYVLPLAAVREVLRPTPEMITTIEGKTEIAVVRDRYYPIVRLSQRFNIQPRTDNILDGLLILLENNEGTFCLLVDDLIGKQEVVIRTLGRTFQDVAGIAGGAILGDGRVRLILDIDALFRRARNVQ
jgi:two-component system chemotaxis sensor kinase CheA